MHQRVVDRTPVTARLRYVCGKRFHSVFKNSLGMVFSEMRRKCYCDRWRTGIQRRAAFIRCARRNHLAQRFNPDDLLGLCEFINVGCSDLGFNLI
jgi:hypothetical protein